jgi:succinate dehydrogenase / fumarate reductase membrane anchor subunit
MVRSITGIGSSGLQEWVFQRVSGLYILFYFMIIIFFLINNSFSVLHGDFVFFFTSPSMKGLTFIFYLNLVYHSWVGIWTILTDYINNRSVRSFFQLLFISILLLYIYYGFEILFSLKQ